jgi:hypothetical protein
LCSQSEPAAILAGTVEDDFQSDQTRPGVDSLFMDENSRQIQEKSQPKFE